VTLFLLQCGSWESYENEQTLLKQVHRSLSMYIEEFLSLLISLSHLREVKFHVIDLFAEF
jgi:hypothetical protein